MNYKLVGDGLLVLLVVSKVGEVIEPDVKIIKREDSTIYEYRINGQLYMVKVQPVVGPPYYLVDRNGDGEFDSRSTDPTNISVPQWILLRW